MEPEDRTLNLKYYSENIKNSKNKLKYIKDILLKKI